MRKPTITICIPTYNRAELLKKTLESVSAQTVRPFQILIVDNASTDDTKKVVNEFKGGNIKYLRNKKNVGMVQNWNICISNAKGEYLTFLHSDDLISPDWYETWTKTINKHRFSFYTSSIVIIDQNNRPKYSCHTFSSSRILSQPNVIREFWTHGSPGVPLTGATIFKKSLFREVGMFNPKFKTEADVPMGYKILSTKDVYYLDKLLFAYRSHKQQGFDKSQKQKSEKEEIVRLNNYFRFVEGFYRNALKNDRKDRFFIQHTLMMNLAPVNLYIIRLQFGKILNYYKTAFKFFPDLFRYPSDWWVFLRYQIIFVMRAFLTNRISRKEMRELRWLSEIS